MKNIIIGLLISSFWCLCLNAQNTKKVFLNDTLSMTAHLMYHEMFKDGMNKWLAEQMPGGVVRVTDKKMEIDDARGCTVWFTKKLKGAIMIEYDALVIKAGGKNDRVSDLNCFWMATDPKNPENFFANSASRGGEFKNYNPLQLYYVGLGGHNNTKTRFRRYTGDGSKPLLPEHDLSEAEFLITPNVMNHIRIIAHNGMIQYYRNDRLIFNFNDPHPYTSGYFGLRTVNNHLTVDNFRVYKLCR